MCWYEVCAGGAVDAARSNELEEATVVFLHVALITRLLAVCSACGGGQCAMLVLSSMLSWGWIV